MPVAGSRASRFPNHQSQQNHCHSPAVFPTSSGDSTQSASLCERILRRLGFEEDIVKMYVGLIPEESSQPAQLLTCILGQPRFPLHWRARIILQALDIVRPIPSCDFTSHSDAPDPRRRVQSLTDPFERRERSTMEEQMATLMPTWSTSHIRMRIA